MGRGSGERIRPIRRASRHWLTAVGRSVRLKKVRLMTACDKMFPENIRKNLLFIFRQKTGKISSVHVVPEHIQRIIVYKRFQLGEGSPQIPADKGEGKLHRIRIGNPGQYKASLQVQIRYVAKLGFQLFFRYIRMFQDSCEDRFIYFRRRPAGKAFLLEIQLQIIAHHVHQMQIVGVRMTPAAEYKGVADYMVVSAESVHHTVIAAAVSIAVPVDQRIFRVFGSG